MEAAALPRLSRAKLIVLVLPLLLALLYALGTVVVNAPDSPPRRSALRTVNTVMDPYFHQNWQLFAPTPPHGVLETWYQVRYRDSTGIHETQARSATDAYREIGRAGPLSSLVERTITGFEHSAFRDTVPRSGKLHVTLTKASRPVNAGNARPWAFDLASAQHSISPLADGLHLPGTIQSIRAYVTDDIIPVASDGTHSSHRKTAPTLLVNTGWIPYLSPTDR